MSLRDSFEKISCVVPARNEAGHLQLVINQILSLKQIDEVIIVEGNSTDNTAEVAQNISRSNPNQIKFLQQSGRGKFDAVLTGATKARNNLIMIWDADGTVPLSGSAEIVSIASESGVPVMGDRLRGFREPGAMRFANFLGNWLFAVLWMPLLRSLPRDLLCGTKIFPAEVFKSLPKGIVHHDPFGDFALIANARMLGLTIVSHPVDYKARVYGTTNIKRWSAGLKLLELTLICYAYLVLKKLSEKVSR